MADQLQTNYASDLRHMLKSVFDCYMSDAVARLDAAEDSDTFRHHSSPGESSYSRTDTSDGTMPNNNNYRSASALLGIVFTLPETKINKIKH